MREAKALGFSDRRLAQLVGSDERTIRDARKRLGIEATFKMVDTCAAEFVAYTPYLYSTYEQECEANPSDRQEGGDPGGRPEPHRPGDRVRLLLRPRRRSP